jgi:membrane protein YdbS with pleckstrin-like domain
VAFPDDVLAEGERVVVHRNPHWRVLVGPVLAFLVVVGAAGYVAALARGQGWHEWGWPAVAASALLLIVWLTVLPLVRWRTTHLVVTTRRLLVREGVRGWQGIQVPLEGITAVRTRRSSLFIETAAGEELEFVDVAGAEQVREALG